MRWVRAYCVICGTTLKVGRAPASMPKPPNLVDCSIDCFSCGAVHPLPVGIHIDEDSSEYEPHDEVR